MYIFVARLLVVYFMTYLDLLSLTTVAGVLYPVYTIEQTSSWLVQLTYSQLVEPA